MFLLLTMLSVQGQNNPNPIFSVAMGEFKYINKAAQETPKGAVLGAVVDILSKQTSTEQPAYLEATKNAISTGLNYARRLSLRGNVQEGQSYDMIAQGTIEGLSTTTRFVERNGKREIEYRADISVTINLVDPENGKIYSSHNFSINEGSYSWMRSIDDAMKNSLSSLRSRMGYYYNNAYPSKANIIERGYEKRDKQKEFYIDLGTRDNMYKGIHFKVYSVSIIAGREARKELGKAKIVSVEGDDISLCKVQSGGKAIKEAFDQGRQLVAITTD